MPIVRREHVTINTEIDESGETNIHEKNSLIQNNEKLLTGQIISLKQTTMLKFSLIKMTSKRTEYHRIIAECC